MQLDSNTVAEVAHRIGITKDELDAVLQRGRPATYYASDYLFHESTPREWLGIVLEGEIELLRGQHGHSVRLGALTA